MNCNIIDFNPTQLRNVLNPVFDVIIDLFDFLLFHGRYYSYTFFVLLIMLCFGNLVLKLFNKILGKGGKL